MRSAILGILVAVAALVAYWCVFTLNPAQQALVLQFGEVRKTETQAGLKFKFPWQSVVYIDKRVLNLNLSPKEIIISDKKRLVVDAFARFKIEDPILYYQKVVSSPNRKNPLATFLDSSLRTVLSKSTFIQVVRDERSNLMEEITSRMDKSASTVGVDVIDVKIRRADLPEANSQAVFRRMQTEREREATEIRAQGEEQGRRIRSRADRDSTVILAEAQRDANIQRGDGDALANEIYAKAYSADADFFEFYRSMQAYDKALNAGDSSLVLSPDSEFFRFFGSQQGVVKGSGRGAQVPAAQ
ncbi:protease modulator HflC [Polycladidibacter hongkongensis]|uniref:protease modulator HflC n=1 Tax=Polycladidibacter hongkongensis TaxID=1647556 RepID=UPI00083191B2|nr:protease modulator HflC [Pseudovibrio hongkongensis]